MTIIRLIGVSLNTTHATARFRSQVGSSAGANRPGLSVGSVNADGSSLAWNSRLQSASARPPTSGWWRRWPAASG